MPDANIAPKYLTDRQVAARYSIARTTVWKWAADGVIPRPVKIAPNAARWPVDVLDDHDRRTFLSAAAE